MKQCPYCAEEIQDDAVKCTHCHEMLDGVAEMKQPVKRDVTQVDEIKNKMRKLSSFATAVGFVTLVIGAYIGFLARPSVPLIGQLPFRVVITKGAMLNGLDQMLLPVAQRSFNYVVIGGAIGAIAGYMIAKYVANKEL